MNTITVTKSYDLLTVKAGKDAAENLTYFIDKKIKNEFDDFLKILATREDLANLKGGLKNEIASSKTEISKWMFIFWVGQIAVTFGFILLFINK